MTMVSANRVFLSNTTYKNNVTLEQVDCNYTSWQYDSMYEAFKNCSNLTTVTNINGSVYNMAWAFRRCSNLVNAPVIPNSVYDMRGTFFYCSNLVNAPEIPDSVTILYNTFSECSSLVNAPVIPNSVTNMYSTFSGCSNLVNAPVIPNSVTNMCSTFSSCTNLVNAPEIPNNITNMYSTFSGCSNLVNAPEIPENITDMSYAFYNCSNLTGNIYVHSENISSISYCFELPYSYPPKDKPKYIFIPYKYSNGVNTLTYNTFTNYGYGGHYDEYGTVNKVYLRDINGSPGTEVDVTNFEYNLDSGYLYLSKYIGSDTDVTIPNI